MQNIKSSNFFFHDRAENVRLKAKHFNLDSETLEEVINRIKLEAECYIEWEDVLDFFTRRGRPKYMGEQ